MAINYNRNRIAFLMHREKLSLSEFARKVGVSKQMVSNWLLADYQPSIGSIGKVCNAFGVEPNFFFSGIPRKGGK